MKKLLLVVLVAALISCSKQQAYETARADIPATPATMLRESGSLDGQVQVYNLLTAPEKYKLWWDHLMKAKLQFQTARQYDKVALVEQLLSNIRVSLFSDDPALQQESEIFMNYFVPLWNASAEQVFSEMELYDLVSDPTVEVIGERTAPPDMGEVPVDGGPAPCFCHVGTKGYTCKKMTVGFPSGISWVIGVCEKVGDCDPSRRGCGFLWLQSCNGNHCNY